MNFSTDIPNPRKGNLIDEQYKNYLQMLHNDVKTYTEQQKRQLKLIILGSDYEKRKNLSLNSKITSFCQNKRKI